MSPEKLETIQTALKLQGDLAVRFQQMGFGNRAGDVASEVMHIVLTSDAVKPEIKAIYEDIANGIAS